MAKNRCRRTARACDRAGRDRQRYIPSHEAITAPPHARPRWWLEACARQRAAIEIAARLRHKHRRCERANRCCEHGPTTRRRSCPVAEPRTEGLALRAMAQAIATGRFVVDLLDNQPGCGARLFAADTGSSSTTRRRRRNVGRAGYHEVARGPNRFRDGSEVATRSARLGTGFATTMGSRPRRDRVDGTSLGEASLLCETARIQSPGCCPMVT